MIKRLQVDPASRSVLGEDGVAELRANLHALDCQTCGRPLRGVRAPTLAVVQSSPDTATASLHHQRCRAPGWSDTALQTRHLSWHCAAFWVPDRLPTIVINPSYEAALLIHGGRRWNIANLDLYRALGLSADTPTADEDPVAGLRAVLHRDRLVIDVLESPLGPWSTGAMDARFARATTDHGKVRVAFTTAADVRGRMSGRFGELLDRGLLAVGNATVSFTPEAQVPRRADLAPEHRAQAFALGGESIYRCFGVIPSDVCLAAAFAADQGDERFLGSLGPEDRILVCVLLIARYAITDGEAPGSGRRPRAREGVHVVVTDDDVARHWAERLGRVCARLGIEVHRLGDDESDDESDDDYLGEVVVGTADRFTEASAASRVERGRLALFTDTSVFRPEILERYRRVLHI